MLSARPLGVQPRGGVISPQPAFMQMVRQGLRPGGDKVKDLSGEDFHHVRFGRAGRRQESALTATRH